MQIISFLWVKAIKKSLSVAIRNSKVHKKPKIETGSQDINSTMQKHSFCGYSCDISSTDIGAFCSIANGVVIIGGMHPMDWVSTLPAFYEGRDSIKAKSSEHKRHAVNRNSIGHNVWIGRNAIIKQGIQIGAVVGMGSIVTKDFAPHVKTPDFFLKKLGL